MSVISLQKLPQETNVAEIFEFYLNHNLDFMKKFSPKFNFF